MKITRIAAVSLTAALAFGCRYDAPEAEVDAPDPTPEPCTVDCEVIDPAVSYSVLIKDEATTEAGEMRFKLDTAQATGELSVNIKVDASEPKLSYIGLYGTSTSTDDALVDLKMGGINSDYASDATDGYTVIKLRAKKIGDVKQPDVDTALEYPADTWVNVSIKWDAGQVTIALFDQATGDAIGSAETHAMQNVVDVQNIIFKISDTSGVTTVASPYLVDDIVVYSDLAQTTKTLSEAFNSVSVPTSVYSTKGTVEVDTDENANAAVGGGEEPTDPKDPTDPVDAKAGDYEWNFSEIDGSGLVAGAKVLQMSKDSDNPRTLVADANGDADGAVHIEQSVTSGAYGYHYTTMEGTADPLAAVDGMISMDITFNIDDIAMYAAAGQDLQLLENTDSNTGWKMIVSKSSSKPQFKIYNGSTSTTVSGTTVLADDTYYHIAATYDNTTAKIYVNGVLEGEETITDYVANTKDGDKVYVGGGSNSSQKNLEGAIDNAAFWTSTLTDDEVAARAAVFGLSAQ